MPTNTHTQTQTQTHTNTLRITHTHTLTLNHTYNEKQNPKEMAIQDTLAVLCCHVYQGTTKTQSHPWRETWRNKPSRVLLAQTRKHFVIISSQMTELIQIPSFPTFPILCQGAWQWCLSILETLVNVSCLPLGILSVLLNLYKIWLTDANTVEPNYQMTA